MEKIIAVTMAALVSAVIWFLKHQVKAQTERVKKQDEQQTKREENHDKIQEEDRKFHRDVITNSLEDIHKLSTENSKLNNQSMVLQKEMLKEIREHDGQSREAWNKLNGSLGAICERLNGKIQTKKVKK